MRATTPLTLSLLLGALHAAPLASQTNAPLSAAAAVDTAIARMGGAEAMRGVQRARFEVLTQWQRTAFDERPYADQPSYEWNTDLRDYTVPAWRNTRRFNNGTKWSEIVDVVRDSVAIRRSLGGSGGVASPAVAAPGAWTALNIAYVDERRELFTLAPERLLLAVRAAADLRALPDTNIAGAPHARVAATVDGLPLTLLLRRSTGFVTAAAFHADENNDFGLAPFGDMPVELWYSSWRKQPSGLVYPFQWDVRRVGKPYKRMTVMGAAWNPTIAPDSFVVSDSLRAAYLSTSRRPMHDVPLDSARIIEDRFVWFGAPGAPAGAVKVGGKWLLLETGQAPLSAERAAGWLKAKDATSTIGGAFVTLPATSNGGVAWLVGHDVEVHTAPGAVNFIQAALRGHSTQSRGLIDDVTRARWLRVGRDSVWMEPIDFPDMPGALVVYVPSMQWLYSAAAANPLYLDEILARAGARGWTVTRYGSLRGVTTPLPRTVPAAGR